MLFHLSLSDYFDNKHTNSSFLTFKFSGLRSVMMTFLSLLYIIQWTCIVDVLMWVRTLLFWCVTASLLLYTCFMHLSVRHFVTLHKSGYFVVITSICIIYSMHYSHRACTMEYRGRRLQSQTARSTLSLQSGGGEGGFISRCGGYKMELWSPLVWSNVI